MKRSKTFRGFISKNDHWGEETGSVPQEICDDVIGRAENVLSWKEKDDGEGPWRLEDVEKYEIKVSVEVTRLKR